MIHVAPAFQRPYIAMVRTPDGSFSPALRGLGAQLTFPSGVVDVDTQSGNWYDPSNLANILGSAANAATQVIRATEYGPAPYVIPGTNVVYNPVTGGVTTGAGTLASQVGPSMTPLIIGGVAVVALLVILTSQRR